MGKASEIPGGRQVSSQPKREGALDCSIPSSVAWITARPASASSSGPASEISSLVSGDDFDDDQLVSTPNPQIQQVLVVQTQNGANMASGRTTTATSTATTAPSTATLPLTVGQTAGQTAGQSSTEPLVPIVVQIEAQDTPSVIQGARPVIGSEQTMQSAQVYGRVFRSAVYGTPAVLSIYGTPAVPYAAMPAMSARPSLPMGYYGMPNPNWMISEREHALQQQLIQES